MQAFEEEDTADEDALGWLVDEPRAVTEVLAGLAYLKDGAVNGQVCFCQGAMVIRREGRAPRCAQASSFFS